MANIVNNLIHTILPTSFHVLSTNPGNFHSLLYSLIYFALDDILFYICVHKGIVPLID